MSIEMVFALTASIAIIYMYSIMRGTSEKYKLSEVSLFA
jgi:hypothetical protein